jgi:SPX domain protein involved in polyphosphate accumulation
MYQEWRFYYLDYDLLKRLLKEKTLGKDFTEYDEASFVETFDKEIQKVRK